MQGKVMNMAKKVQIDEVELRRLQAQDKKISALLDSQKELNLAVKTLVLYLKERDLEAQETRNLVIRVERGCVTDVFGLPENWTFEIDDRDVQDEQGDECVRDDDSQEDNGDPNGEPWKQGGFYGG